MKLSAVINDLNFFEKNHPFSPLLCRLGLYIFVVL